MKRVLLLLCEGVEVLEAAAFYDVLGWASAHGPAKIEVVTAGLRRKVRGTFGLRLTPDVRLADADPDDFDALAIPGGFERYGFYTHAYARPVADLIRAFDAAGKPIAAICVGALPLAHSGILRGRRATTYSLGRPSRRKQLAAFGVMVVDEPIVVDRNVITSTSPATAMEVAFLLLARLAGEREAAHIRHLMGYTTGDRL